MDKETLERRAAEMRERNARQKYPESHYHEPKAKGPNNLPECHQVPQRIAGQISKPLKNVTETVRRLLSQKGPTGYSDLELIVFSLAQVAKNQKHPRQIDAFNALMDRGYGKAPPSAEELEARGNSGFVVILERPQLEAQNPPPPAPEPKFIEGEVVDG